MFSVVDYVCVVSTCCDVWMNYIETKWLRVNLLVFRKLADTTETSKRNVKYDIYFKNKNKKNKKYI